MDRANKNSNTGTTPAFDAVVCGGGPAGMAAAIWCSRLGLATLLVEKNGFCGGAAVAGLSGTVCGMYTATNEGTPHLLVRGFAQEFLQRLDTAGGLTPPQQYGKTLVHTHEPLVWRETADTMLQEAGVHCLYHTTVAGVHKQGNNIHKLRLFSSAGSRDVDCKVVIDTTGDGVVAALAGCSWTCGHNGSVQYPTMMFRMAQIHEPAFHEYYGHDTICPQKMSTAMQEAHAQGMYDLPRHKIWIFPTPLPHVFLVNATRIVADQGLNPLFAEDRTYAEMAGRKAVREVHRFLKDHIPGCADSFIMDTGTEVGVRQTRSIETCTLLHNAHVLEARKCDDGVVRCAWPIELHASDKPKLHWLEDDYYELPYLALVARDVNNLLVAGRCLGAEHEALASIRVTAQCLEMGHAAAVAAHMSIAQVRKLHTLDGKAVRECMREHGSHI